MAGCSCRSYVTDHEGGPTGARFLLFLLLLQQPGVDRVVPRREGLPRPSALSESRQFTVGAGAFGAMGNIGGWVLVASAFFAYYTGMALVVNRSWRQEPRRRQHGV